MNDFLLDISTRIEPEKAAVLTAVNRVACRNSVSFIVAGGTARDFILQNGYGVDTHRVTLDVDVGVRVSSWGEYSKIIDSLLTEEYFTKTEIEHRYKSSESTNVLADILPFGGIETDNRIVQWGRGDNLMNMAGFSEAYTAAVNIKIVSSPSVVIKVASLAGLVLLKLICWSDRPAERDRDAKDIKIIMYNYLETYPGGSLFDAHPDISGDDFELISARALGRDLCTIGGQALQATLEKIVGRECDPKGPLTFIMQMRNKSSVGDTEFDKDFEMMRSIYQGIADIIF